MGDIGLADSRLMSIVPRCNKIVCFTRLRFAGTVVPFGIRAGRLAASRVDPVTPASPPHSHRTARFLTPWPSSSPPGLLQRRDLDLPLFRPDISPVAMDRASVMRCRRSLPLAVVRCCCCHRCCQLAADCPVASRPARCRGWPASGPGRLPPGPWSLTGLSAEAPGSSVTSRVRSPGTFPLCSFVRRSQSRLRLEGRTRGSRQRLDR
jgi:hypothetical protein